MDILPKKIKISEETIKKAYLCRNEFECLSKPERVCPVKFPASDDLLFVSRDKNKICDYYVPFGNGGFCTCPVRKEIYSEYNR